MHLQTVLSAAFYAVRVIPLRPWMFVVLLIASAFLLTLSAVAGLILWKILRKPRPR